jgi:hypothetical protein
MMGSAFAATTTGSSTVKTAASSSVEVAAKITCVGNVVNTREKAIDAAVATYTQAVNSAYSARATALQQAYAQTTLTAVKNSKNATWSDFNKAIKSARSAWVSAKNSAWSQYRTTAVACKAPDGTGDGTNSSYEVVGQ